MVPVLFGAFVALNLVISWYNCRTVGRTWDATKVAGGWWRLEQPDQVDPVHLCAVLRARHPDDLPAHPALHRREPSAPGALRGGAPLPAWLDLPLTSSR